MIFGQWLKERRKRLDLTQATLGRMAGCSESSIRKIESGILKPSRQVADLLASSLQVPEEDRAVFVQWARTSPGSRPPARLLETAAGNQPQARTRTQQKRSSTLPVPPTSLIGRETNVADVLDLLVREGLRLLTLTGPPGTGKTRLALQVATEVEEAFQDGALFVPLAYINDPKLVISTLSRALGVAETKGMSEVQVLAEHLQDKQMMIVLDNFEQVIAAADDIAELLVGVRECVFVVTSREALHVRGEQIYSVPPLALPADSLSAEQVEQIEEVPAVALFVQRALDTDPGFHLTKANAAEVADICRKLEGMPLAIELAAARIAMFPPSALLARLDNRLSTLTDGARDLPPRQRTIRNAIASSYDLLEPAEQLLFRRLSVFSGGWRLDDLDGVWRVANDELRVTNEELVGLLDSLRAKSLLRQEALEGEPRFVMLEMIRQYALEKLQQGGEEVAARREHAIYFTRLAEEAEPLIRGGKQVDTLNVLEREHANLRAALGWAHQSGDEGVDIAARMCAALSRFWLRRGHWTEGRRWIDGTLTLLEQASDKQDDEDAAKSRKEKHARMLHMAGVMAYRQGDYQRANSQLRESVALWRKIGDRPQSLAEVLQDAGTLAVLRDEYGKATRALTEALEIHRAAENRQGSAQILTLLGFEAMVQGNFDRSNQLLHEALELFSAMGDRWGVLRVQQHIAVVARNQGEFARAQRLLDEVLEGNRQLDNKSGIAAALGESGLLALAQGDHVRARTLIEEVQEIYGALGGKSSAATAILTLGLIALYRGDYPEAEARSLEAMKIYHHEEARYDTATSLMALAGVASARGQAARAARLLGASETIFQSLGAQMDYFSRILQSQLTSRLDRQVGQQAFTAARQEGAAMTIAEAVRYAETGRPATAGSSQAHRPETAQYAHRRATARNGEGDT